MTQTLIGSEHFGLVLSICLYLLAVDIKVRLKLPILNSLLVSTILVIGALLILKIPYEEYAQSASLLSYLLTPATVCLAIPMYKQLKLLRDNLPAVLMGKLMLLPNEHILTLLPKSITTAIGMGVSEESGGIVALTVASIVITGILGNMIGEPLMKLLRMTHPIAKGLALGTSSHAIGTAKALELGEIEGAMSSLSIVVAGVLTVIFVPVFRTFLV